MHHLVQVTPENIDKEKLYCSKDVKSDGFKMKKIWFNNRFDEGLKLFILKNEMNKPVAFIEYIPIENAWRPIEGKNYFFIHCLMVYSKNDRDKGFASELIKHAEYDARSEEKDGIAVITSDGAWLADKTIFMKNGYYEIEKSERFELMIKKFADTDNIPKLVDITKFRKEYDGWNVVYSDQCPWHDKAAKALKETAAEQGFQINIRKIETTEEAKKSPSAFGTFSLIKDGKLIEDHYISKTRFLNILKKME